jgi:hypothetical protein
MTDKILVVVVENSQKSIWTVDSPTWIKDPTMIVIF